MVLKTGNCTTCTTKDTKLRPNPFTQKEQCEKCRDSEIIGITDIKKWHGLKDKDLDGLNMTTEAKPAFLGGPDRRWYLLTEVEEREKEVEVERKREKEEKEEKKLQKEKEKAEKMEKKEMIEKTKRGKAQFKNGTERVLRGRASKTGIEVAAEATEEVSTARKELKRKRSENGDDVDSEAEKEESGDEDDGKFEAPKKGKAKPKSNAKTTPKSKADGSKRSKQSTKKG